MKHHGLALVCGWAMLLLAAAGCGGDPEAPPEPRHGSMQGDWEGTGMTLGLEAHATLSWEEVLDRQFLKLTLRNEMKAPDGTTQLFEAHAYYQMGMDTRTGAVQGTGTWFDSRGMVFPIRCVMEETTLRSRWGTPETEEGESIYRMLPDGTMEIVDSVKVPDGAMLEFSRITFRRR